MIVATICIILTFAGGICLGATWMQGKLWLSRWEEGFCKGCDLGKSSQQYEIDRLKRTLNYRIDEVNIWRPIAGLPLEEREETE